MRKVLIGVFLFLLTTGFSLSYGQATEPVAAARGSATCSDGSIVTNFIPFIYTLGESYLGIQTNWGTLKTYISPFAAHGAPHTGHYEGNKKADWQGAWAMHLDEMYEIPKGNNDGDGICEVNEECGIPQNYLDNMIPTYIAPANGFVIDNIVLESTTDTMYYDPQGLYYRWGIIGRTCDTFTYEFVHLAHIGAELKDLVQTQCNVDLDQVNQAGETNLIQGCSVTLNYGDRIAKPSVIAEEVGSTGYYVGMGGTGSPFAQIEFPVRRGDYFQSFYSWLDHELRGHLESIFYAQVGDPTILKYKFLHDGAPLFPDWLWKSEMVLTNTESVKWGEYDSIHGSLGGWWEQASVNGEYIDNSDPNNPVYYECNPGQPGGDPTCDSLFTVFPIAKHSPMYDSSDYLHPEAAHLATRKVYGENIEHGEVVRIEGEMPNIGSMLIRWRLGNNDGFYQPMSFYINKSAALPVVKIRWGSYSQSMYVSMPDIPDDSTLCNEPNITCHAMAYFNSANVFE